MMMVFEGRCYQVRLFSTPYTDCVSLRQFFPQCLLL